MKFKIKTTVEAALCDHGKFNNWLDVYQIPTHQNITLTK